MKTHFNDNITTDKRTKNINIINMPTACENILLQWQFIYVASFKI